jgi:RNA polymerase sigma-70 factor, ECF subfamily
MIKVTATPHDSSETFRMLQQVVQRDRSAFDRLFNRHRGELRQMVQLRLDPAIRARLDPSDVVQETHLDAVRRLDDYLARRPMPFRIWLRKNAQERLAKLHRDHRRAARRSVDREQHLPEESSILIAAGVLRDRTSPSEAAMRREFKAKVAAAVEGLSETDREILLMRNAEGLSHTEIAYLLDIAPATSRKRYARALMHLRKQLIEKGLVEEEQ